MPKKNQRRLLTPSLESYFKTHVTDYCTDFCYSIDRVNILEDVFAMFQLLPHFF